MRKPCRVQRLFFQKGTCYIGMFRQFHPCFGFVLEKPGENAPHMQGRNPQSSTQIDHIIWLLFCHLLAFSKAKSTSLAKVLPGSLPSQHLLVLSQAVVAVYAWNPILEVVGDGGSHVWNDPSCGCFWGAISWLARRKQQRVEFSLFHRDLLITPLLADNTLIYRGPQSLERDLVPGQCLAAFPICRFPHLRVVFSTRASECYAARYKVEILTSPSFWDVISQERSR